jgi:predicted DNA repair protein MutK
MLQIIVVSLIAVLATVGVYGLVALIVRMDDTGFFLIDRAEKLKGLSAIILIRTGRILIASLPLVIRALGVVGTIAMLLVGGGMYTHNIETLHHMLDFIPSLTADFFVGLVLGSVLLGVEFSFTSLKNRFW